MAPHEINSLNNFMMAWRFKDTSFCDSLIDYYNSKTPIRGETGAGVNLSIKDSFDVLIGSDLHSPQYFLKLQECVNAYIENYGFCNAYQKWGILESVQIQKYIPQGAYHRWHCERSGSDNLTNTRHLVFMTYLNDVTDAGETEFFYQHLKLKPEKGLTVLWPADWMFTHRGIPSPTQEKMIVTGWFNFKTPDL